MRRYLIMAAVIGVSALAVAPSGAAAQSIQIRGDGQDSVARFSPRRAPADAILSIISRSGDVALMHVDGALVFQLTDAGLERIAAPRPDTASDQRPLARLLDGMLRGGIRVMLDRALEYDLADIGDVRFDAGELILENRAGERMFDRLEVNGEYLLRSFHERDARAFAAHLKRHLPR